ncbi:MAG: type I-E CRISPR-associated protein Cas7/Cse4/CasC [Gammaproteobacteria bacterium]|nr:type I-E CRISPR-associated protein Cas7/Cse4/CasC [Gammaproteobacteria bacterium]
MSGFIQLHYLTVYPPSNPNRDDLGRPKTVIFGGEPRLRISSQAIKRAVRISDTMQKSLQGHMGERTQRIGEVIRNSLLIKGANEDQAIKLAKELADVFGKIDVEAEKKGQIRTRQLAFVSPEERAFAIDLAEKALNGEPLPSNKELKKLILRTADGAVDVGMFGRMLADDPDFNREAAVQISHALTTHRALVEDDFYTAADDLKSVSEDAGAGFVGDSGFGSGIYYLYACVDTELLIKNLDGDKDLAAHATSTLAEALAISTPSGKRNSFAHQTRAGYIRAEYGHQQPRSLAGAFFKPVIGDLMEGSIAALTKMNEQMSATYGPCQDRYAVMNMSAPQGSITEIRDFVLTAVLQNFND